MSVKYCRYRREKRTLSVDFGQAVISFEFSFGFGVLPFEMEGTSFGRFGVKHQILQLRSANWRLESSIENAGTRLLRES
jgi:hypothetical protein